MAVLGNVGDGEATTLPDVDSPRVLSGEPLASAGETPVTRLPVDGAKIQSQKHNTPIFV
jgi:hypothetical protein